MSVCEYDKESVLNTYPRWEVTKGTKRKQGYIWVKLLNSIKKIEEKKLNQENSKMRLMLQI